MTTDKLFTISEAARVTGKSLPTIRAALEDNRLPNARSVAKGKSRSWQIPLTDLVAAGLLDKVTPESEPQPATEAVNLRHEIEILRVRLEAAERRADTAEKAAERFSDALQVLAIETREKQEKRRGLFRRK